MRYSGFLFQSLLVGLIGFLCYKIVNNLIELIIIEDYRHDDQMWSTLALMCRSNNEFCRNIKIYSTFINEGYSNLLKENVR